MTLIQHRNRCQKTHTGGTVCGALALALLCIAGNPAFSGTADVVAASASCSQESICTFTVTVRHADEGWKHYADRWEILSPEGDVLATRILRHPHVEQQPFTRKLEGVRIPASIKSVRVRARDSVHGFGGTEVTISLRK